VIRAATVGYDSPRSQRRVRAGEARGDELPPAVADRADITFGLAETTRQPNLRAALRKVEESLNHAFECMVDREPPDREGRLTGKARFASVRPMLLALLRRSRLVRDLSRPLSAASALRALSLCCVLTEDRR
jgi:hypothetical protein